MTICVITTGVTGKIVQISIPNTNRVKKNRAKNIPISLSTSLLQTQYSSYISCAGRNSTVVCVLKTI